MAEAFFASSVLKFVPAAADADMLALAPQPLKDADAATFIDAASSLLLPSALLLTCSVAKSLPPSCTLVQKISPKC